jgi:RNA polymerase sigma factor (sigma-70 family)
VKGKMKFNNDLVIKAQNGDIHAFERIVDNFQDMAIGYAYSILKDYHYAEDVAQEAFFQAFFKLSSLQSAEAFPSWFRKIVFSQCEHFYRKKRLPVASLDDVHEMQSHEQSPSEIVEQDEMRNQIMRAVKALPEKERTITVLFYISEYSMSDIGRFLDLPISTIKNRLFAARKKLRGELGELMSESFIKKKTNKEFTERVKNMIISGYKQSLLVREDGTVMSWGNLSRYSDPRTANDNAKPMTIIGLKNAKSITASVGCHGSYALLIDGKVWAWGWNVFHHLGTGSKEEYITAPEEVKNIGDVISVSAGVSHALALKKDGTVWAWGKNWYGQQGNGRDNDTPAQVPGLKKIRQISAGFFHSLALAEDGTVWRWGGYGDSTSNFPMVYTTNTPVGVQTSGKIIAISAGGMHSVLLREDETVWACGYNTQRQLGSNQVFNEVRDIPVQVGGLSDVKAISAGGGFSLALKKDGTVWAWGGNENGELGNGTFAASSKLTNLDYNIEPVEVSMLQDVVEISAGGTHAMAVTSDDGIWTWGGNDEGQLGDFTEGKRCVPQRIM